MIPNSNTLLSNIEDVEYPGSTYKVRALVKSPSRINGYTNGIDAIKQSIYFILNTERYKYILYSWDYGVELFDLIGQPMPYVMAEIPRRIEEALKQDDRILRTENYEFEKKGKGLKVTFTVVTNVGDFQTDLSINNFTSGFGGSEHTESNEHKHAELTVGGTTYVYCEDVKTPYIEGNHAYLPYAQYPF